MHLHIQDRRERLLVGAADRVLAVVAALGRPFKRRASPGAPRRILLLRLERIGDLLMALPAIRDVRTHAPGAQIDLVVGSWNATLAHAVPGISHVETLDARWLAREGSGQGLPALIKAARGWRARDYDLAVNFEPDIRSNLIAAATGARWVAGYGSGGGAALLDVALEYDTRAHTTGNARRLVAQVFGRQATADGGASLLIPERAALAAAEHLRNAKHGPVVAVHTSGGRAIKQWEPEKFAEVARRLMMERGATILLTGSSADAPLVDVVKGAVPRDHLIDITGDADLIVLAAILQRVDLLLTGDTGPLHVAGAVGTPVVAVFGPSDPARYGPTGPLDRVVRLDLPCSPCNRIRLPPERCVGHTPDCLALVTPDQVYRAVTAILDDSRRRPARADHATA